MNLYQFIISKKWMYLIILPTIIFIIASIFTLIRIINYDTHYTVMPVLQTNDAYLKIPNDLVGGGETIKGEFISSNVNLGAVALRIKNIHKDNVPDNYKDYFRIKEKNANAWYTINSYNAGQFK